MAGAEILVDLLIYNIQEKLHRKQAEHLRLEATSSLGY